MAKYIKTEEGYKELATVTDDKMDKTNPTGTGSFSMNRKAGTVVGLNSHAEGYNTTASGEYSHAEGNTTTASGGYSHAEGLNTKASGVYSHAEGRNTTASGNYSHAEGNGMNTFSSVITTTNPTTYDIITYWQGKKFSLAKGNYSHVEGMNNLALGNYSHAEGSSTIASGEYSHAEGNNTTASGTDSHAEGLNTKASGECSHVEGKNTTASGYYSHAEGNSTKANGESSHAEGQNTTAKGDYSHVQGKFNIEDTSNKYADIIGNGTSTKRSNAATVDWEGNAWYAGDVYVGSTSGTNEDAGSKKLATEEYVGSIIDAAINEVTHTDAETLNLLIEEDMLPAVHDTNGKILTDENSKIILRY